MKILEVTERNVPMDFVNKIRIILGTTKCNEPTFIIGRNEKDILGACYWKPGNDFTKIEIKNKTFNHEQTLKRAIAHELCHDASYLLYWLPKFWEGVNKAKASPEEEVMINFKNFIAIFQEEMYNEYHGKIWQEYANKVNSVFGPTFVTAKADGYIAHKS
jgi:hypothetical protein